MAAKTKKKPPSASPGSEVREEVAGSARGDDQPDREARRQDDRVRQQLVLEVDRREQDERRAEDGAEERVAAEAEPGEARDDERDRRHRDDRAERRRSAGARERRALDLRRRLGAGSGWAVGSGTGIVGTLISLWSAWKMDTTAGPRMTTNRAGKIMKTSGKSILIGAFCACCSACARRRLRISIARLRRICPTETPSSWPCTIARANDSTAGVGQRL